MQVLACGLPGAELPELQVLLCGLLLPTECTEASCVHAPDAGSVVVVVLGCCEGASPHRIVADLRTFYDSKLFKPTGKQQCKAIQAQVDSERRALTQLCSQQHIFVGVHRTSCKS